jgi:hypothetical protein
MYNLVDNVKDLQTDFITNINTTVTSRNSDKELQSMTQTNNGNCVSYPFPLINSKTCGAIPNLQFSFQHMKMFLRWVNQGT